MRAAPRATHPARAAPGEDILGRALAPGGPVDRGAFTFDRASRAADGRSRRAGTRGFAVSRAHGRDGRARERRGADRQPRANHPRFELDAAAAVPGCRLFVPIPVPVPVLVPGRKLLSASLHQLPARHDERRPSPQPVLRGSTGFSPRRLLRVEHRRPVPSQPVLGSNAAAVSHRGRVLIADVLVPSVRGEQAVGRVAPPAIVASEGRRGVPARGRPAGCGREGVSVGCGRRGIARSRPGSFRFFRRRNDWNRIEVCPRR